MTWANRLTMLRVVLAVAVFFLLLAEGLKPHALAFVLFLAAIVTDWLDGWLARRTGTTSPFGKVADPIADKILVLGTFIALIRTKDLDIPLWAVFLMIARELLIGGVRVLAGAQGKVLAADKGGKVKMAVQSVAVLILVGVVCLQDAGRAPAWLPRTAAPLTVVCAVLSLSSLWSYLRQSRAMLEKSWS
ncbi:MAG: CDP-diacylglycerol--glycerol-3-phosphate 3-phosphatidyltransferase [Elusimicrobiota bacterium]|nr:CDP-diacylglycerol--glycerol-3-phosphate 3-phosphatidyltransferase [Elusimicrobiota bacterium]